MMASSDPAASMLARADRLDLVVGCLEEIMRRSGGSTRSTSPAATTLSSSAASTPSRSRGTCRSAQEALQEAQAKGSLVDRIALLESRVVKMEEITSEMGGNQSGEAQLQGRKKSKGGFKRLLKTCVKPRD